MNHRDAEMCDVVVILDKSCENKMPETVETLKVAGLSVSSADDDNSVVEGTIDATKLPALEKLDCVDYVRKIFSYVADFPTGDPRDQDCEDESK